MDSDARSDTATVEALLNVKQACAPLNIGRSTLYDLVRRGELAVVHVRSAPRFEVEEIRDLIRRNRRRREPDLLPEHEAEILAELHETLDAREVER